MLSGDVSFENFADIRKVGESLIDQASDVVVLDLAGLTHANSLTVSAMVAWFRYAIRCRKSVTFTNVSEPLQKIIRVSGLKDVLLKVE
jgi:ABC-type transporter Mla MlaB component